MCLHLCKGTAFLTNEKKAMYFFGCERVNPLQNDKLLDWSKLKAFTGNKIKLA